MSCETTRWFVLGFTSDDVIVGWQDSRVAEEYVHAWRAAGSPPDFQVLQTAGEGAHLTYWFVNEAASQILDAHKVGWRKFLIGERTAIPLGAQSVLRDEAGAAGREASGAQTQLGRGR